MIAPDNCPGCQQPLFQWGDKEANIFLCAQKYCGLFEFMGKDPVRVFKIKIKSHNLLLLSTAHKELTWIQSSNTYDTNNDGSISIHNDHFYLEVPGFLPNLIEKNELQLLSWIKNMMVFS